jgi:outer membrane protein OmpA-like peptidoglycan-associated protein
VRRYHRFAKRIPSTFTQEADMVRLHPPAFRAVLAFVVVAALVAAGCAQPGVTAASRADAPFDEAIDTAVDNLFEQQKTIKLPEFLARTEQKEIKVPEFLARLESKVVAKRTIALDPVLEAGSGNQTAATQAADARIAERVAAKYPNIEIVPFDPLNLARAQYVLTGTMSRTGKPELGGGYQIDLALSDLKTRAVAAQASARARPQGIDTTPTVYYRDSPVLLQDGTVERAVATSRTPPGQPAAPGYLENMPAGTLLAEATNAYNADRIEQALSLYTQALSATGGDQIRVHNGIYLSNWRLGRVAEAEQAFGRVVASGLASRNLGVKFLFKANSTDFWPDQKVSNAYDFWLRQIAKQAASSKTCLQVVGHTSRTGSEQYNDQLSQRRALYIKQRLETESPELAARTRATGMGFRENLIGTGTDDMRDALDRRVEFKIDAC